MVRDSVFEAVREAMELSHWRNHIVAGAAIAIKPNLGWDLHLPGAVTSPWVIEGVIQVLRERAGQIFIVEAGQVLVDVEKAARQAKIPELCTRYGVTWINMSRGEFRRVKLADGLVLKELNIPEILTWTTLVTVPVMKTHAKTQLTGAIKNQWGCLPEFRHNYHPVVNQVLADLNKVLKPQFAIVDATICLEGNGPKSGRPKKVGYILASPDIVAADAILARIMGIDSVNLAALRHCAEAGLGHYRAEEIELRGAPLPKIPFQSAKHNTVSFIEETLRHNAFLRRIVFDPFVLKLFCWGAIGWYLIWYYLGPGKIYRDAILADPFYGAQWRAK